MQYLKEKDISQMIQNDNVFLVPKFLFSKEFRNISANSKLLFSFVFESKVIEQKSLANITGYSSDLVEKCVVELAGMNLITIEGTKISVFH